MSLRRHRPSDLLLLVGRSGTGKSAVAACLRAEFGLPVLELGPLFRYAALLGATRSRCDVRLGATRLEAHFRTEEAYVDMRAGDAYQANRLYYRDQQIGERLWDERLAGLVVRAAEDPIVRNAVTRVARNALSQAGPAIVTGREALGRTADRSTMVELVAADAIRHERKQQQLEVRSTEPSALFEPRLKRPTSHCHVIVDTSDLTIALAAEAVWTAGGRVPPPRTVATYMQIAGAPG